MWLPTTAVLLIAALVVIVLVTQQRDGRRLRTTHLRLMLPELPADLDELRLIFLSDLHVKRLYVSREDLLASLREIAPDILLLGGDYTYSSEHRLEAIDLIAALSAICRTFAVRGNTDLRHRLDCEELSRALRSGGGALLVNDAVQLKVGDCTLEIVGIDNTSERSADPKVKRIPLDSEADLRIGMTHSPEQWQELADLEAHISVCGHTHGGQVRIPGAEALITHRAYPRQLAAGLFRLDERAERVPQRLIGHWKLLRLNKTPLQVPCPSGQLLYVSRGVGVNWLPVRVFCPPEMVLMELARDESDEDEPNDD